VCIGHHQFGLDPGLGVAGGFALAAAGRDVVEYPFLVADLLVDVLGNGVPQRFVPRRQASASGHQQRHGVPDVMEGLTE
jgi:hypothetical protein